MVVRDKKHINAFEQWWYRRLLWMPRRRGRQTTLCVGQDWVWFNVEKDCGADWRERWGYLDPTCEKTAHTGEVKASGEPLVNRLDIPYLHVRSIHSGLVTIHLHSNAIRTPHNTLHPCCYNFISVCTCLTLVTGISLPVTTSLPFGAVFYAESRHAVLRMRWLRSGTGTRKLGRHEPSSANRTAWRPSEDGLHYPSYLFLRILFKVLRLVITTLH